MEIWDAYNEQVVKVGCDLIRGEPIPDGLYHLVCDVLVQHVDESYLLMQRDFNKIGGPGKFEASAGGSALKGETPYACAVRELKEETGITATSLTPIYQTISSSQHSLYFGYLCVTDCPKAKVFDRV